MITNQAGIITKTDLRVMAGVRPKAVGPVWSGKCVKPSLAAGGRTGSCQPKSEMDAQKIGKVWPTHHYILPKRGLWIPIHHARAARRFLRKLMRRWGQRRVVVTDKLRSYDVALRMDCRCSDHCSHKRLNNQIEASHHHTRRRETKLGWFKSAGQAQRFFIPYDQIITLFCPKRHRLSA
jgi:hypothetical protein